MKLNKLPLAGLAALFALAPAYADFNSKDARKAGFAAKDGKHDGQDLTAAEDAKVKAAIDMIRALAIACGDKEAEKCADGLEKLRKAKRICREDGKSKATSTLPDGKAGCAGDGMNIPKKRLCEPKRLIGTLCHEWVHVTQTGPYPEKEAYEEGKEWLVKAGMPAADWYFKWYCCRVKVHCKDPAKKKLKVARRVPAWHQSSTAFRPLTPEWGYQWEEFGEAGARGSTFYVQESSDQLVGFADGATVADEYSLSMVQALSLTTVPDAVGPNGGKVLAIGGVSTGGAGVIEYVEIDTGSGATLGTLATATLPNADPLSLAFEPLDNGTLRLYVLDTYNQAIWLLQDSNADGLPDQAGDAPWATRASFPGLKQALAITNNLLDVGVMLDSQDTRIQGTFNTQAPMWALFDQDNNGNADAQIAFDANESMAIVPFAADFPFNGDMRVGMFGTRGQELDLWTADDAGNLVSYLGSATAGSDNVATLMMLDPLVAGEHLAVDDQVNYPTHAPGTFTVAYIEPYGDGCQGPNGENTPKVSHLGSSALGATLTYDTYDVVPGTPLAFALGFSQISVPLPGGVPGCNLLTSSEFVTTTTAAFDGYATYDLAIPSSPALVGLELFSQWVALDPAGNYASVGQRVVVTP